MPLFGLAGRALVRGFGIGGGRRLPPMPRIRTRVRTRGSFKNTNRMIREAKAAGERGRRAKIFVGFRDKFSASLAATHEYGLRKGRVRIPARPAFQYAIDNHVKPAVRAAVLKRAKAQNPKRGRIFPTYGDLQYIRREAERAARVGYASFRGGAPLSEVQQARKRGTRGSGKLLVGARGPRLANRITAWIET